MCGTCGCKSAESGKKNCGCGQDPCITFGAEWVVEAVQQNLNDEHFVNTSYAVLIGGDAKTFEEKSKAIAETMNQNANNPSFTSFVESELFSAETFEAENGLTINKNDIQKLYITGGRYGGECFLVLEDGRTIKISDRDLLTLLKMSNRKSFGIEKMRKYHKVVGKEFMGAEELFPPYTYDYSDEVKARVLNKILLWHENMQLQSDEIADRMDRILWMLDNPDKDWEDWDSHAKDADEPEMVHCSFCSKIIGTEEEVYDEESVEWYNANGETICPSCHKQREQEYKNDLDPHYSPFYAETFGADEQRCPALTWRGKPCGKRLYSNRFISPRPSNDPKLQGMLICGDCVSSESYAKGLGEWVDKYGNGSRLDAENERPQEMSYFFVYVPSETGRYGREGEKYDYHYFRTLEEAQKAFGDSYEIYEYRALEDVPPEERKKQKQDYQEWYDRSKKGEFFEDFWWKDEMSRYGNSDAERLHHSTYDSSVERDEKNGFYEQTILPSDPSRREQEINRYLADDLGISETLAELLNASRSFGMYISQRAHPDTVKKYRQRILDGFDAYSPESKKEQKIVKMVRQNMATRGVKGPSPSYASSSLGVLRKPELHYAYDDYYDNPIPFMGYELTDEEKKIIGDVKSAETEKPFWENITMSSQKKKEISPLYQGLIASGLVIVALRIMDKVKK